MICKSAGMSCKSVTDKAPDVLLYSAMTKAENKVGGGEGLEGVYGSINRAGTAEVLNIFKEHAGLGAESVVLDIGSGLGRPLLHAILHSNVSATYGIEVDAVKCQKACPFIALTVAEMRSAGINLPEQSLPKIVCAPIEQVPSLEPATHVYSAWEGFSTAAKEAVGERFARSRSAKAITIVQRSFRNRDPAEEMEELGFGSVELVKSLPVFMSGSRRQLVAYCFVRPLPPCSLGNEFYPLKATSSTVHEDEHKEDLSTMPHFQPGDVMGMLTSQASSRATSRVEVSSSMMLKCTESVSYGETGAVEEAGPANSQQGRSFRERRCGGTDVMTKCSARDTPTSRRSQSLVKHEAAKDDSLQSVEEENEGSGSQDSDRTAALAEVRIGQHGHGLRARVHRAVR
ncbi:hypothetical protein CEUSTIGMA_g10863.t1 [Chlamydomonas eustigma]|uniref:DOT1 domain-containing protein n=1 Tax=Chlamydomonas eustigma TaxID=1157962 RepID=A0A250XK39_9CHLO|nr:hypothetical protein CEUSTIGMA_g10863.t1 [Chlamydomonas eustigma]|eukprot:GAX83438.1 hypothetical protein CEUSTIGMA_g10863.t1 [Chlamydomonas eustigma]